LKQIPAALVHFRTRRFFCATSGLAARFAGDRLVAEFVDAAFAGAALGAAVSVRGFASGCGVLG
jgi:hypothetical protein